MKLLAIETATNTTRVAVLEDTRLLSEVEDAERAHAAALLPAVERALEEAGFGLDAVEAFAVSIGPGSFTGLRIGLSTLKGLAFGTGKPTAPVPTLAAMAWPHREAAPAVVACLDAQRGELYAAAYRAGGALGLETLWPECVLRPDELAARLPEGALVVGEGSGMGLSALGPSGPDVGALGARVLAAGGGVDAALLVPRYVRRAEAEARRLASPLEPADPAGGAL